MATLILPAVINAPANGSGVSTLASAAITIPANVLVAVDVVNRHTTPASLGTVTLAGSTLGSIGQRATVTEGGASPTRRLTRFYILSSVDVPGEVLTATASGSQTGIGMRITAVPGGYIAGGVSGAVRGSAATANSGGASVTTFASPPTLPAFGDAYNGGLAAFISGAGAVTPKTGWTEVVETTQPVSTQHELQWIDNDDVTANATQASATLACIFDEIVAAPNPVTYSINSAGADAAQGYASGNTNLLPGGTTPVWRAGKTMLLAFVGAGTANNVSFSIAFPKHVNGTQIHGTTVGLGLAQVQLWLVTVTGTVDVFAPFTLTAVGSGSGNVRFVWQVIDCTNLDTTKGSSGIIQLVSATATVSATPVTVTPAAFSNAMNCALVIGFGTGANGAPIATGAIVGYKSLSAAQINNSASTQAFSRPNAPQNVNVISGQASFDVVVLEMAALTTNPPALTLVSPSSPSSIPQSQHVTITATDLDGDLSTVDITANGETVYTAGAFVAPFGGSVRSTITGPNGYSFDIVRTGGWNVGALGITVSATDALSHSAFHTWNWTVAAAVTHPPVITLISPPEGPMQPIDSITVDVTDLDGDLATILAVFSPSSELGYAAGAFGANYAPASTQVAVTGPNGFRLTFKRAGGFAVGPLSLVMQATDAVGNVTNRTFNWTVAFANTGPSSGGFIGSIDGFDDPTEDLFFDENFELDATGDLLTIDEPEAVRQAIVDVARTSPGEYAPRPEYGAGLKALVKKPRTQAIVDQARQRVIEALQRESRVEKVIEVVTQNINNGLKLYVKAIVAGQQVQLQPIVIKVDGLD